MMRWVAIAIFAAVGAVRCAAGPDADAAQRQRVAMLARVAPTVVCIYPDQTLSGGGSGVVFDPRGYGLTNFHVIAELLKNDRRGFGGMANGGFYPLTVVGVDPGGDVALFQLEGEPNFPFAALGDSDALAIGQPVAALGNPFLTAEDFQPTVTYGYVSGLHRYQYGEGNALEYADCIQVTTSINPGNSGGPLVDMAGRVIGINGRASFKTQDMLGRGRVNVGLGYAISINQIKRFLPCLAQGRLCEHGTLGATVRRAGDALIIDRVQPGGPAARAGVAPGDVLVALDDQPLRTANEFNNAVAIRPADALVTLDLQRDGAALARDVRLAPLRIRDVPPWVPNVRYADDPPQFDLAPSAAPPTPSDAPGPAMRRALSVVVKLYGGAAGLAAGYGSGVLTSDDGQILTVLSPLLDATNLRAVLPDGRRFDARVVRRDAGRQLALLDIEAAELDFIEPAASASLSPGDWLLAAANPFKVADGPEPVTLTPGALAGRTTHDARRGAEALPYRGEILLTDMVVATPGSAGGGLFDAEGRLVGLIGKPVRSARTNTWLNYALPGETLRAFLAGETRDDDAADAGWTPLTLGVHLFDVGGAAPPAYIERVVPNSPADRAGVLDGDLLLAVAGRNVADCGEVVARLAEASVAAPLQLLVKRGDDVLSVDIASAETSP